MEANGHAVSADNNQSDHQAMSEALARGEQFTRIFVAPMIEAMSKRLDDHMAQIKTAIEPVGRFDGRITKLESNQKKALAGWGVFATALSGITVAGWAWFKGHIMVKLG